MEHGTRHATRNLWMLIAGVVLVVGGLSATLHESANGAPGSTTVTHRKMLNMGCTERTFSDGHVDLANCSTDREPFWMVRRCAQEDSVNCFWDAKHTGNLRGHPFFTRQVPHSDVVCRFYLQENYGKRHDSCF